MRSIIRLAAVLALASAAAGARADVTIVNLGSFGYFYGQLGSAATATGPDAYVQCQISRATLSCAASDQTGASVSCTTADPAIKNMFPMMDKSSVVQVFYDNAGNCTRMAVVNRTANLRLSSPVGTINNPIPPVVDLNSRTARGTIGARPAIPDNHNEGITCTVQSFGQIFCGATDSNGTSIGCYSGANSTLQTFADQSLAVLGITEFSYVSFTWDNTSPLPTCTSVLTLNASYYAPR